MLVFKVILLSFLTVWRAELCAAAPSVPCPLPARHTNAGQVHSSVTARKGRWGARRGTGGWGGWRLPLRPCPGSGAVRGVAVREGAIASAAPPARPERGGAARGGGEGSSLKRRGSSSARCTGTWGRTGWGGEGGVVRRKKKGVLQSDSI